MRNGMPGTTSSPLTRPPLCWLAHGSRQSGRPMPDSSVRSGPSLSGVMSANVATADESAAAFVAGPTTIAPTSRRTTAIGIIVAAVISRLRGSGDALCFTTSPPLSVTRFRPRLGPENDEERVVDDFADGRERDDVCLGGGWSRPALRTRRRPPQRRARRSRSRSSIRVSTLSPSYFANWAQKAASSSAGIPITISRNSSSPTVPWWAPGLTSPVKCWPKGPTPAKSPCAIMLRSWPRQPEYWVANSLGGMPEGGDSTAVAEPTSVSPALRAAAAATSRCNVVDCMSGDLLCWVARPSGEGRWDVRDREVARGHVADRAGRQQRVEQLAGDVALERGPRREDVEGAEAARLGVRQPGLREQAGDGGQGGGQLLTQLGVLGRVDVAQGVGDEQRVHGWHGRSAAPGCH